MKTLYKTAAIAICSILTLAACGNIGAQNDKKDKTQAQNAGTEKAVKELNSDQFNTLVYNTTSDDLSYLGDKPAIVDFTATWCGPCQRIAPILEELAAEYADQIVIYKVDIDKERALAQSFGVSSIPAVLYIPGPRATDMNATPRESVMTIGARSKDKFREEIKGYLLAE